MFDRFSRDDRTLFMFATQEARDLGHSGFGNDHLILGMLCNARSPIFGVLGDLGFTLDGARKVVADHHSNRDDSPFDAARHDEAGRYEEDRDALRSIGIDLDRLRDAVRDKFGDDLADGWGERPRRGRGRGRGHGGDCGPRRDPRRGGPRGFRDGEPWEDGPWGGGPWEGGRGRRGPRGRGRPRADGAVRDAMTAAVGLARQRGDERIGVAHLMLGILEAGDPPSRAVIESVSDVDTVRAAVEELLAPAAV